MLRLTKSIFNPGILKDFVVTFCKTSLLVKTLVKSQMVYQNEYEFHD